MSKNTKRHFEGGGEFHPEPPFFLTVLKTAEGRLRWHYNPRSPTRNPHHEYGHDCTLIKNNFFLGASISTALLYNV